MTALLPFVRRSTVSRARDHQPQGSLAPSPSFADMLRVIQAKATTDAALRTLIVSLYDLLTARDQ